MFQITRYVKQFSSKSSSHWSVLRLKNEDEFLEYFSDPYEIQSDWQDKVDVIVAGGNSIMEPSTIIDCTGHEPELVREGAGKLD